MDAGLQKLNALSAADAAQALQRCCGARSWVSAMVARRPFATRDALFSAARECWRGADEASILEAFTHHPRIGDLDALRTKFASTAAWAGGEQAAAATASEQTLRALADGNRLYEERFGFLFIVCATGKTAEQLLAPLHARLGNERGAELRLAAAEQEKITALRLQKLLEGT